MPILESMLSRWSHHRAATAFTKAHLPVRAALDDYNWSPDITYEVFLLGSYNNDTNLGGDSKSRLDRLSIQKAESRGALKEWLPQVRAPTVEVLPGRGAEGNAGKVRKGWEERPEDSEA